MNRLSSYPGRCCLLLKKDFRIVFQRLNRALFRGRGRALGFMLLVVLTSLLVIHPWDRTVIELVGSNQDPTLMRISRSLGWWGDFAQYNLTGFVLIWMFGSIFRNRWLQRLAVATFLSALMAGLSVNALRFSTGRPRPYANLEDRFHGIPGVLSGWEYHGFPSGHTSTAMGMGVPVVTAGGIYGIPVLIFSTSVGLSRIYQKKHYPTDVIVGGAFGIVYGCASGWHLRKVRLRLIRRKIRKKQKGYDEVSDVPLELEMARKESEPNLLLPD